MRRDLNRAAARRLLNLVCGAALLGCGLASTACDGQPRGSSDVKGEVDDLAFDAEDVAQRDASDGELVDANDRDVDQGPAAVVEAGGSVTLTVDPAADRLVFARDGTSLLELGLDGVQLGVVGALDATRNYDPTGFLVDSLLLPRPPLKAWRALADVGRVERTGDALRVPLRFEADQTADLLLATDADGRLRLHLLPTGGPDTVAYFRLRPALPADEAYYGLGESFDHVNQRGHVRAMQLEVDTTLESGTNEAHVPIPLLLGTRGWGLFVDSDRAGVFDVAAGTPDRLDLIYVHSIPDQADDALVNDGFVFYLFAEGHPLDLTRHYYELTGFPGLPARWALGPWIWRDENDDQAQVLSDGNTIRDLDLATTGYWIDRPYASGVNTFDFETARFPDAPAMLSAMQDLGFRLALWHTPYVDEADPTTADLLAEVEAQGYFPLAHGILFNHWGQPIDLTNPAAFAWWQGLLRRYTDVGIEGFKLDYAEDITLGVAGLRNVWRFADGSDERTMHAAYQRFYHRAYSELLPDDGGFILARGGTSGDQAWATVIWPGDLDADFSTHGETRQDADGTTYRAVGGLPASLVAALSLGPSGFPLFGSDTGGYRHAPPDKETFVRWFELTAFSTVMQVGTNSNDVPWEFDAENGFDDESLALYRRYARWHLRLFPYLWTHVLRVQRDGRPVQRALGLAYPELGVHPDDIYLLGDDLLVAPVVTRDARTRTLSVPPGEWVDWWTGVALTGPTSVTVDAPLDTLPVYQRAGSLVPLLRPTIDTLSPVADSARIDSYATDAGLLTVRTTAGPESHFELFDGSTLSQSTAGDVTTLTSTDGEELAQGVLFEVLAEPATPTEVLLDGVAMTALGAVSELGTASEGWIRAPETGGTVWIRVPAGTHTVSVSR